MHHEREMPEGERMLWAARSLLLLMILAWMALCSGFWVGIKSEMLLLAVVNYLINLIPKFCSWERLLFSCLLGLVACKCKFLQERGGHREQGWPSACWSGMGQTGILLEAGADPWSPNSQGWATATQSHLPCPCVLQIKGSYLKGCHS